MTKLTLSMDEEVVARAKRYAASRRTSVSQLVERYLSAVSQPVALADEELPPKLKRLRGVLKGVKFDRKDYIDYLERKYR